MPTWQGLLLGRLRRARRYPEAARERSEEGVATVGFALHRLGHVLSVRLARSSGHPLLDEEATAMVRRADPLPAPPPELRGDVVTLVVPLRFVLER